LLVVAVLLVRVFGVSADVAWDYGIVLPLVAVGAIVLARQRRDRR